MCFPPHHTPRTLSYLKYYGHINSLRWWQNDTTAVKHYGRVSETPCFPGKIHRKSPQTVNYYGDSKNLRHSIFNTAGSAGPLGKE